MGRDDFGHWPGQLVGCRDVGIENRTVILNVTGSESSIPPLLEKQREEPHHLGGVFSTPGPNQPGQPPAEELERDTSCEGGVPPARPAFRWGELIQDRQIVYSLTCGVQLPGHLEGDDGP